jgi:hypothetical protein
MTKRRMRWAFTDRNRNKLEEYDWFQDFWAAQAKRGRLGLRFAEPGVYITREDYVRGVGSRA